MSSFARRIQRQVVPSAKIHWNDRDEEYFANQPRRKFYMGRGSKLGVRNPKAADLLARTARERARAA